MSVEAALAACRFAASAAAMMLWGAAGFLAVLAPPALRDHIGGRVAASRLAALLVAASALILPVEAADVGDGWPDALDPATLAAVLGGTGVGRVLVIRLLVALLLAATLACPAGSAHTARLSALLAGLFLATLALSGHAAMHEGALGLLHRLNDAAHVLAAGAWIGALPPLLPTLRALDRPDLRADAVTTLRRFSVAGHAAVALALATGLGNAALVLGRRPAGWSPYLALLAAKVALVAAMVALSLVNRYLLVPGMARRGGSSGRIIRRTTIAEVGLGFAAIACVSVFGLLDPS